MWAVCITSISHVLKLNGYGRRQTKVNGKRLRFRGGVGNFSKKNIPENFNSENKIFENLDNRNK